MTANHASPADFHSFFERTFPRALAWALMRSGNRHDAEDAVQEAFAQALRRWDRIGGYDSPEAWVFLLVRQQLQKSARRWRRSSSLDAMELTAWAVAPDGAEASVHAKEVLAALAALPDRQRVVMVMHCLLGMDQQEIAAELGLRSNAVRQRIFKARRALEKVLDMPRLGRLASGTWGTPGAAALRAGTLPVDRTAAALLAAESWLREEIEGHDRARERVLRAVVDRAARIELT